VTDGAGVHGVVDETLVVVVVVPCPGVSSPLGVVVVVPGSVVVVLGTVVVVVVVVVVVSSAAKAVPDTTSSVITRLDPSRRRQVSMSGWRRGEP
jgi:hypothetical protein